MCQVYQQELNVMIAETLEKLQDLDPELYAFCYSKLYQPYGDTNNWNVTTLHQIEQFIIEAHN